MIHHWNLQTLGRLQFPNNGSVWIVRIPVGTDHPHLDWVERVPDNPALGSGAISFGPADEMYADRRIMMVGKWGKKS